VLDGYGNVTLDVLLDVSWTNWISPHLQPICKDASLVYASKTELLSISYFKDKKDKLSSNSSSSSENYLRAVRPVLSSTVDCGAAVGGGGGGGANPCLCTHPVCIGWYPCALKYCRSKQILQSSSSSSVGPNGDKDRDETNMNNVSNSIKTYRCGIHTCKSCRNYLFTVNSPFSCLN
jgi:hypothetical protein